MELLLYEHNGRTVLEHILDIPGISISMVDSEAPVYEQKLDMIGIKNRSKFSLSISFNKEKAENIYTRCDLFLMPSIFEPCGIAQMEAMSYATPVIARATGGLKETIQD